MTEKFGQLIGLLDGLTVDERLVVNDLLKQGKTVEVIPTSKVQGEKTPDFKVNGILTELKSLQNHNLNTPLKKIRKALDKQGGGQKF